MFSFARDCRIALRTLSRTPGFSAIAVLTFALGIGANTAIFSVVNSVLLKPLGYANPDRLVIAEHLGPSPVAPATFLDWKQQSTSFEQMAAAQAWGGSLRGTDRPEPLIGLRVTSNLLSMLGVPPIRGRTFAREDERDAVVIAYSLWQRTFGGAPDVLGRKIEIDGAAYTVIGIMPEGFRFAPVWVTAAEIWAPLSLTDRVTDRSGATLRVFARLRSGVSVSQAQAELSTIMGRLAKQYPDSSAKLGVAVVELRERVVGDVRKMLLVLLGTVSFVLLIACANIANLLLARASGRSREIAVRLALGATRRQLIKQAMTESGLLAVCGGMVGLVLAYSIVKLLNTALPPGSMPRQGEIRVDLGALVFTAVLSVLTGMLSGLVPAWRFSRGDVNDSLKEGGRSGTAGREGHRARNAFVICEMALAFVLLIGAGLMLRSFASLLSVDPGFERANLLSLQLSVSGTKQADAARRELYYREVNERVAAVPGVSSVSAVNHAPITGDVWGTRFRIAGRPEPLPGEWPTAVYRVSWPGYFHTMRTRVLRGREFTTNDNLQSPRVLIVNEAAARRYWPNEDAIGKTVITSGEPWTIVGIVHNVKQQDWQAIPREEIYFPLLQSREYLQRDARHYEFISLVVRVDRDPAALAVDIRHAIESIDPNVLVSSMITMERAVANNLWRQRLSLLLLGAFGILALVLAVTGIYGVVSHAVSQRTQEIGIRMALGAARRDVLILSIRRALAPVMIGIAAGIALALALARLMATMLYGIEARDTLTFFSVALLMCASGIFAAFWPAARAARVDPMVALRHD
jgi:putative ABC transport system permease protein